MARGDDRPTAPPAAPSDASRWAALAIVAVAVIRVLVSIQAQVRFDTDPAINPDAFAGIGPAGSFALDIALLLASAMAFVCEARAGRGVRGWLVACAVVPGVAVFFHGSTDAIALFRGSTWLAAAIACVAAAHLARSRELRSLLVAGSIAVAVPLVLRGAEQVLVEHPETVRFFEGHKEAMFAERGWTPDGPAAQMFERRLRQTEATGWFGLANIYSSVMAFGALTLGGLAIAGLVSGADRRERRPLYVAAGVGSLACVALLAVNGSKGAIVATAIGLSAGLVAWRAPRWSAAVAIGAIAAAALAPSLRGFLPEGFLGERSLLFRSQYLSGAIAMLPHALPFGIGPDSFQAAYMLLKPARSPEDVVSSHAMAVDWLVLLGPLGLAWVAIVVRGFCGRWTVDGAPLEDARGEGRSPWPFAVIAAAAACAVQAYAEQVMFDVRWIVVRSAAALALAGSIVLVTALERRVGDRAVGAALLAGLVAVFAQAQIEMILFQPGSVVWALVALGAYMGPSLARVAPPRSAAARLDARSAWIGAGLTVLAAVAVAGLGLVPQVRQDRLLDEAAHVVSSIAVVREEWPIAQRELATNQPGIAVNRMLTTVREGAGIELESALRQAVASGPDASTRVANVVATLRRFDANQRARAADLLQAADAAYPANRTALEAAVKQLAAAGRRTIGARRGEIVEPMLHQLAVQLAAVGADRTRQPFAGARFHAMLADLRLERVRAVPDSRALAEAALAVGSALDRQPRSAKLHADLGDVCAAQGDAAAAADAYGRSLAIDDDLELDPVARFSDRQREEIEARLAVVRAARESGEPLPAGWPFAPQASNATSPVDRK